MFKLELLDLLKQYSKGDEYKQKKVLSSIKKMIEQHPDEFQAFVNGAGLSDAQLKIIQEAQTSSGTLADENESDLEKIKKIYEEWREEYVNNGRKVSEKNEALIVNLIKFYAPKRFSVIQKVLNINDDDDFTAFKNTIENYLRIYFSGKIAAYRQTPKYEKLSDSEYNKTVKKIKEIYEKMDNYEFDIKLINEVLE